MKTNIKKYNVSKQTSFNLNNRGPQNPITSILSTTYLCMLPVCIIKNFSARCSK